MRKKVNTLIYSRTTCSKNQPMTMAMPGNSLIITTCSKMRTKNTLLKARQQMAPTKQNPQASTHPSISLISPLPAPKPMGLVKPPPTLSEDFQT